MRRYASAPLRHAVDAAGDLAQETDHAHVADCANRQICQTQPNDSGQDSMPSVRKLDGWSSPVIESVTHTTFSEDGSTQFRPDGCWDFAILKSAHGTTVLRTGLTTTAVTHAAAAGDEILAISFKASAYMELMPGERMRDQGVVLDTIGRDRFRLGSDDGVSLELQAKAPGDALVSRTIELDVGHASMFPGRQEAYQRLLEDAMAGDHRRFGRGDGVEEQWRIVSEVLASPPPVELYRRGTWGPSRAEVLTAGTGGWIEPV
jgi:hypothetical protein